MLNRRKYFIYMTVLAVGCYFMYEWAHFFFLDSNQVAQVVEKKGSGTSSIGGNFSLIDHRGKSHTSEEYKGKYLLVYFGYSFCPDVCPTALYNMTQALNDLGDENNLIQPIFITIDPERDNMEQLEIYRKNFHQKILMLTGSVDQIRKVAKAYRVYYAEAKPQGTSTDYLVDHSSIVYFMDPQGHYLTSFNHETSPSEILKGIKKFIQ